MATQGGTENPVVVESASARYEAVTAALRNAPFEFDFFQAVRLLERMSPNLQTGGGVVGRAGVAGGVGELGAESLVQSVLSDR